LVPARKAGFAGGSVVLFLSFQASFTMNNERLIVRSAAFRRFPANITA
jgi:hypothetical protein